MKNVPLPESACIQKLPPQFKPLAQNFTPPTLPLHRMLSSDCEIAFNTFLWIDRRLHVVVFF